MTEMNDKASTLKALEFPNHIQMAMLVLCTRTSLSISFVFYPLNSFSFLNALIVEFPWMLSFLRLPIGLSVLPRRLQIDLCAGIMNKYKVAEMAAMNGKMQRILQLA